MILNVTNATGRFWDGVQVAGDYYDVIGGSICGCFLIIGGISVLLYKPWRRWMARRHGQPIVSDQERYRDEDPEAADEAGIIVQPSGSNAERGHSEVTGKAASAVAVTTHERRIGEELV